MFQSKPSIKQRVLDMVSAKLDALNEEYAAACFAIDQEAAAEKAALEENMVESIVSKIL